MRYLVPILLCWFGLVQVNCAPSGVRCETDLQCPTGEYCDQLRVRCVVDCVHSADCATGKKCDPARGRCQSVSACVPRQRRACAGQNVHWFDSCGVEGERFRSCGTAGCSNGACVGAPPSCGDGTCDATLQEDCSNCVNDCACPSSRICQEGSCIEPPKSCGNGTCEVDKGENCTSCKSDCGCASGKRCRGGKCEVDAVCGDGKCDTSLDEHCGSCAKDCACASGETCYARGCIPTPSTCGDGKCSAGDGEHCGNCGKDCPCSGNLQCIAQKCQAPTDPCGDGTCDAGKGENCTTCAKDCTCPSGQMCQSGKCQGASLWPQKPPVIHSSDKRRLMVDGKTWYPVGLYPGAGMNMTGIDYKGDVYLYWKTFVDKIDAAGLDLFRVWVNWGALPKKRGGDHWDSHVLTPYMLNGAGKVDLTKFNPDFFKLLKTFVDYTHAKGIVVQLSLLDCWHVSVYGGDFGVLARDYFKKGNNINGVDFSNSAEWTDPKGRIFPYHKRFVEEVVKTVGASANVIWETCNELILGRGDTHHKSWERTKNLPFHKAITQVIRAQEQKLGFARHLVLPIDLPEHRTVGGHGDVTIADNAKAHGELVSQYAWNIPLISDNDCFCKTGTADERRQRAWAVLTAGAQIDLFDNKAYQKSVLTGANLASTLTYLGHVKSFLRQSKVELAGMKPSDALVSGNGWVLAAAGSRYIIYLPKGGSVSVRQLPGQRIARWFNPRSGTFTGNAGQGPSFQAPDTKDWVLFIEGSASQNCGNGTCDASKGENCTTCGTDCACPSGQSCQSGQCQAPAQCITKTIPDFTVTSKNPSSFTLLPMTDGKIYKSFKVSFSVNPTKWQPDCNNTYYTPPRPMSPYQVLVGIRKGRPFCRGGGIFGVNVRGGRNGDIWADTYYKPSVTASCGKPYKHTLLPSRPKHGMRTGKVHQVSVEYNHAAGSFKLTIDGRTFTGKTYAQAVLQSKAGSPLYLVFSLERWLECFNSQGKEDKSANCCHLPNLGWQYRGISYELCP